MLELYIQDHASTYSNARFFSLLYSTLDAGSKLLAKDYSNVTFFSDSLGPFMV
jgi:hypothetical protein